MNNEIHSVNPENKNDTRFVNSNLLSLLYFVILFSCYGQKIAESSDDNISIIIDELTARLKLIDAKALENEDYWWSIILEQIENGLI